MNKPKNPIAKPTTDEIVAAHMGEREQLPVALDQRKGSRPFLKLSPLPRKIPVRNQGHE